MRPVALSEVLSWLRSSGLLADGASLPDVDGNLELTGFAAVDRAGAADVTFWLGGTASSDTHANGYASSVFENVHAGLLFAPPECAGFADRLPGVRCLAVVENPYHAMVEFLNRFASDSSNAFAGCSATAQVHPGAVVEGFVGEGCVIGPGCVVMRGAKIGANCVLEANVTVYPNVEIGEGCIFQAGVVVGSRGFGFYEYAGKRRMVPHYAGVRIGKRCSFGANSVVAAGFVSPTTIGNDCHFDSFVQIGHNCILGNNIFMASQSGLAGTVVVEDDVELAGGAQVAGHLTLGKGCRIAAKAGVTKSIPAGRMVSGFPAIEINIWRKAMVNLKRLGEKGLR